jgi:hypothetical protein
MVKATKTGRLREKTLAEIKRSKQTTFDSLPAAQERSAQKTELLRNKHIVISGICCETKENDLDIKVGFRLFPSRISFSKISAEIYFDGQRLHRYAIRVPQGPLSADEFEFPVSLDMKGIRAGQYVIRVEMFELWDSVEKLTSTSNEVTIDYVPVRRQDRFIKIPIVKNSKGEIDVVLEAGKDVYREVEDDHKKEVVGKRDVW